MKTIKVYTGEGKVTGNPNTLFTFIEFASKKAMEYPAWFKLQYEFKDAGFFQKSLTIKSETTVEEYLNDFNKYLFELSEAMKR